MPKDAPTKRRPVLGRRRLKVDDVNAIALHEDVGSHCGIPFSLEVTEVTSGLQ